MFRRYVLPCLVIMAISVGTAGVAFAAMESNEYSALCSFQVYVRLSPDVPQTVDTQRFVNALASQQVTVALSSGMYKRVADRERVDLGRLATETLTVPGPGLGVWHVKAIETDRARAIRVTNAVCDEFVTTVKKQRADEINNTLKNLQNRITAIQAELRRLEAIPTNRRTASDRALIEGHRGALAFNSVLIRNTISLPPDSIAVLTRAETAQQRERGSLTRNLIIAVLAGLLACFLYVLIGEVVAERKRGLFGDFPPADLPPLRERQPSDRR